jgi:HYR domain/Secretion system C-terminal sorting domain
MGIFSMTLSFASNPTVPNEDPDPCKHDKEAPHIECPEDVYAYADCDEECVEVKFREPRAKDDCDKNPKVWCEYQSGHCFPIGKTEVWCWARDKSGNESKHYFNVIVKGKSDKEAPRLHCPKDIVKYVDCQSRDKCVKVNFDAPQASDDCDPHPRVYCEYESGYCFPIGTTEVWCWAEDKSGNESKCYFTVTVKQEDHTPPVVMCPKDMDLYMECNAPCTRLDWWMDPMVKDDCDPSPRIWQEINGKEVSKLYCFPLGKNTVTAYAEDKAGNRSSCTYYITVKYKDDFVPPVIRCPSDVMYSLSDEQTKLNKMCRTVTLPTTTATDNCTKATITCTVWNGSANVSADDFCFMLGKTRVTCTATDVAGNKSSCGYWVTIMRYGDKLIENKENNTAVAGTKNGIQESVSMNGETTTSDLSLGSTQRLLRKEFAVYPNPTNGLVNLELAQYDGKNVAIQVLNSVGQQVYNLPIKEVTNQTYSVDMLNYPTGIYLVKVSSNGIETISKKIMKQ